MDASPSPNAESIVDLLQRARAARDTSSLLEGREPEEGLGRACAAGALAASRFGAQPSLPTAEEVDAILRA